MNKEVEGTIYLFLLPILGYIYGKLDWLWMLLLALNVGLLVLIQGKLNNRR